MDYIIYAKEPGTPRFFAFAFFKSMDKAMQQFNWWKQHNSADGWEYKLLGPDDKFMEVPVA